MEDEEIDILRSVFNKFDFEKSGYLSPQQFTFLILRLGKHIKELEGVEFSTAQAVFHLLDTDGDNQISFKDFVDWWRSPEARKYSYFTGEKGKLLRKAYQLYSSHVSDKSNMTYSQFNNLMEELNIRYSEYDFDALDTNGDGLLSFCEFINWLNWF